MSGKLDVLIKGTLQSFGSSEANQADQSSSENAINKEKHFSMIDFKLRRETFSNWPFNGLKRLKCTADAMARSGFYCPNPLDEPDTVCCFLCMKTLDGWEKSDVPDEEHGRNHENACLFLTFKERDSSKMTLADIICLKKQQHIIWNRVNSEERKYFTQLKGKLLSIVE